MLRRGIYLLGSALLRRNAFTFHLAMKPMLSQGPRVFKTPCFRFASELPSHEVLKMPALSPTMATGKIVKWYKKPGDEFAAGDVLCDVETDKATVPFEMTDKGFLAKTLINEGDQVKVGEPVVVIVSKKDAVAAFANFKAGGGEKPAAESQEKPAKQKPTEEKPAQEKSAKQEKSQKPATTEKVTTKTAKAEGQQQPQKAQGDRVVASPLAKKTAQEAGVDLTSIKGSGPGGRIIKQDVDSAPKAIPADKAAQKPKVPSKKVKVPQNQFEQIPLTSMRQTIAKRLLQAKTTIPHYYVTIDVNMDKVIKIREELNQHEKDNGVKISINDIIMKASALASRDFPDVNVQWHETTIRKFKYVDLAMAVSTDKGLITPIIFRADTKGLIEIAKASKDLAKRARESKLQPQEFQGGTLAVSNVGMFGVNSIYSIINPPQSLILGVGKSEKKIVFDEHAKDPEKPYKVANMLTLVSSADHRVVDGALASQWLSRVKKYLEEPSYMLL